MKSGKKGFFVFTTAILLSLECVGCGGNSKDHVTITNVSYDPTRELFEEYNSLFKEYYYDIHNKKIEVIQSHGGSGSQARSVVEGCNADVVTLALEHDITLIERTKLIDPEWKQEFKGDSAPYTSMIVLLVRNGNKKNIHGWNDLVKKGVEIITPDPKSSGGACWNFLAAWSYAKEQYHTKKDIKHYMKKLYANVSVMDSGARSATTTFVENKKGDVLIAWENEAIATIHNYPGQYEMITPDISILAQPSVAIVDDNAKANKTTVAAKEYLSYLYSDDAQRIIGRNGYRPWNPKILKEFSDIYDLQVKLTCIDDFGGWDKAYKTFFEDGAIFDQIYQS